MLFLIKLRLITLHDTGRDKIPHGRLCKQVRMNCFEVILIKHEPQRFSGTMYSSRRSLFID